MKIDAIQLGLFSNRINAIADEMGAVLRRAAFSPNIKDRLDFSCAIFDAQGDLCAQAAHIPVHLGSMAYATRGIIGAFDWQPGDTVILNDPFRGGTHLPDITLVSPVFYRGRLSGFVANRAHHANVGAEAPGSMPISRHIEEEGVLISPTRIGVDGELDGNRMRTLLERIGSDENADIVAQWGANRRGLLRLGELLEGYGEQGYRSRIAALQAYGERLALQRLGELPKGEFSFVDYLDDDGQGTLDIPIRIRLRVSDRSFQVDFAGTAGQVSGNLNCPISVTAASVYYVFRCLLPEQAPTCAGLFAPIDMRAPQACLVNACYPAAVAAGNVETSQRIADVLIGALQQALPHQMPAASQGTMNNLAMGAHQEVDTPAWSYYETLAGGTGAHAAGPGLHATHSHMTNTLNTPVESLETHYPLRILRYAIRRGSGGVGRYPGGDGLIREYQMLKPARATLLTERRRRRPWGMAGGGEGQAGRNRLNDELIPGKVELQMRPGDRLCIETPGGGGWGSLSVQGQDE